MSSPRKRGSSKSTAMRSCVECVVTISLFGIARRASLDSHLRGNGVGGGLPRQDAARTGPTGPHVIPAPAGSTPSTASASGGPGRGGGPDRAERLWQVDTAQGPARLRAADVGDRPDRRRSTWPSLDADCVADPGGLGATAAAPLRRVTVRQHRPRPTRRHRRSAAPGGGRRRPVGVWWPASPRASPRCSARTGPGCPPVSASAWPWLEPFSATPRYSSWTSPRPISMATPRTRCSRPSGVWCGDGRALVVAHRPALAAMADRVVALTTEVPA